MSIVFKSGFTICIAVLVVTALVHAGTLTPSASPAATSYTLDDIYTRLTTNATSTAGNHLFTPGSSPAASLRSLTEIYSAIPTIVATSVRSGTSYLGVSGTYTPDFPTISNVCDTDTSDNATGTLTIASSTIGVGNTYCGVAGILLKDQFNGSLGAGGFAGGSQASGGVEDSNNGGSPAVGRYAKTWTACSAGNNYCGTGDTGADAKDDSTGLVWSLPCNGSGCSSFSDSSPAAYSWDSSGGNNNSRTASQLCTDHSGWSLPHQKQLLQAYINGAYGNVEAAGTNRFYWSATTQSDTTTSAWRSSLASALTSTASKSTATPFVRCVR